MGGSPTGPSSDHWPCSQVTQLIQLLVEDAPKIFGEYILALLLRTQAESTKCAEYIPRKKNIGARELCL